MLDLLLFYLKEIGLKDTTDLFITFLGVVVTGIGIIVTGVFSWLLWKATQQTNKLAEANHELAVAISNEQRQEHQRLKERYRTEMWKKAVKLRYTLESTNQFSYKVLLEEPLSHEFSDEFLGKYFDESEQFLIDSVWATFKNYIEEYWSDDHIVLGRYNSRKVDSDMTEMHNHCSSLADQLSKTLLENDENV
ncbi:hypothetical protein [Metabacillus elymi]|uniref:Uncharacterized protein n=1 Tax=Metabacillus elymi TaxID=2745198 RepID=A0ABX6RZY8_9BACI|nr:hypothetical protein [Metabacillus sp. KUDC1714]QNF26116.1 hypothetical protein HUW50_00250 [Metabacillus sp. KUDC1714]